MFKLFCIKTNYLFSLKSVVISFTFIYQNKVEYKKMNKTQASNILNINVETVPHGASGV